MYKKILLTIGLFSSNLFSNDNILNDYFSKNDINILCKNNICEGSNIKYKDINIDKIGFNSNEINLVQSDFNCNDKDKQCKIEEEKQTFLNLLLLSSFNDLKIENFKSNNSTIEKISSSTKIPLIDVFNKDGNLDVFKNNQLEINIVNSNSNKNEFNIYYDYIENYLIELSSIPKNQWNDEIHDEIEYNMNLLKVISEFKDINDIYNYNIILKSNDNKNLDLNEQEFLLSLDVQSKFKKYKIDINFEFKNLNNIKKILSNITNKPTSFVLILPYINIKSLDFHINIEKLRDKHNLLLNKPSYKNSFEIVENYNNKNFIIDPEYQNDLEYVEYIKFMNKLILLKNNEYHINVINPDPNIIFNIFNGFNMDEDLDVDKIFDSLDWKFNIK